MNETQFKANTTCSRALNVIMHLETGHYYFGENRTFLFGVDSTNNPINPRFLQSQNIREIRYTLKITYLEPVEIILQ